MVEPLSEFRRAAREWLARMVPAPERDVADYGADPAATQAAKEFQAALYDARYAGISWPVEYGGHGLPDEYERAFVDEAAAFDLPARRLFLVGIGMCGPTLLALGSEEQKRRYLPALIRGEQVWCQLFSEPGAGSDVASLQSTARAGEDGWVLSGQKVWTTHARAADYGLVVARTDPDLPKHDGLSMFVLDMKAPGITIRPLRQMTGDSDFNEVFFDDVRVPAENLVGRLGDGWRAARVMLMNERTSIGAAPDKLARLTHRFLAQLAAEQGLAADPAVRRRLADLYLRERALELLGARIRASTRAGVDPGPVGSVAKLVKAQLTKEAAEFAFALSGPGAAAWDGADSVLADTLSRSRQASIAGGTDDIQRNIIGERLLGLPREPGVDRGVPFRDLRVGTQSG